MSLPYWAWRCSDCGKQTTKSYASNNKGRCKSCVEGKTEKVPKIVKPVESKSQVAEPETLITKNFNGHNAHWIAEIYNDHMGFSAIVKCSFSKNWPIGFTFFCYNLESVEKLCDWISDDLKDRETESGIMYHSHKR